MGHEGETSFELLIPNQLGYEKLVRQTLAWLLPRLGFEAARIADVQTAVSEACINAIEHGNDGLPDRRVRVTLGYTHDQFCAVVADEGVRPCPSADQPCPTISQKLAGAAPARGMGLMLMRALVDEVRLLPPEAGQGNRCWLRVHRPCPRIADALPA
jgi:serine/threonine-protein kinase RsbW